MAALPWRDPRVPTASSLVLGCRGRWAAVGKVGRLTGLELGRGRKKHACGEGAGESPIHRLPLEVSILFHRLMYSVALGPLSVVLATQPSFFPWFILSSREREALLEIQVGVSSLSPGQATPALPEAHGPVGTPTRG